jgi:hypothetical protein
MARTLKQTQKEIAEINEQRQAETDQFYAQQQVIDTLTTVLEQKTQGQIYVAPAQEQLAPNYLMYLAIGGIALLLFLKGK